MNYFIGIDPGSSSGSVCVLKENEEGVVCDYIFGRFDKQTPLEIIAVLKSRTAQWRISGGIMICVLEKVGAMPGQGVSSTFKFGQNYGWIKGVLDSLGIPYTEQPPGQWMKGMNLLKIKGEEKPQHKKRRREFIERTYPHIKVVDNTFDSLILAECARQKFRSYGRSYQRQ